MDDQLQVKLLGNLQLHYKGSTMNQVKKSTRAQLLLAYLILNRTRPCGRNEIALRFWPDTTNKQARVNLRKLIYDMRRWLPNMDEIIRVDNDSLCWQPTLSFSLDVINFEQALTAATTCCTIRTQQAALTDAVELYCADLLTGHYEEWILPERDRLHRLHITALEKLIELTEQQQDFRSAIRYGHRLLRYERLHESTYCTLMRLHRFCGERGRAVQIYEHCEQILDEMLDTIPSAQTRAEFERLM